MALLHRRDETDEALDMLEIWPEAVQRKRKIHSGPMYGNYDHVAYQERMKKYISSISGSKSKEEKGRHGGVCSSIMKCSYCSDEGHGVDQCMLRIANEKAMDEAKANRARTPVCEMCKGAHHILHCEILAPYRAFGRKQYEVDSKDDSESDSDYAPKSPTYSGQERKKTKVRPEEVTCDICYKKHRSLCPYMSSVPKDAPVSPFYPIVCEGCGNTGMNSYLWCARCKKYGSGYVIQRINCMVCGEDMSSDCCPYGKLIGKKPKIGYISDSRS